MAEIEIINYDYCSDEMKNLIEPYFLGKIFHCAKKDDFDSIIKDNFIDYTKYHTSSYGYKQKCVCLCDYRKLYPITKFYEDISEYINRKHIFILKQEEYSNVIPPKTEEQYELTRDEGWLIPDYECWYKDILPLDKIEKIYLLNEYNKPDDVQIINETSEYLGD